MNCPTVRLMGYWRGSQHLHWRQQYRWVLRGEWGDISWRMPENIDRWAELRERRLQRNVRRPQHDYEDWEHLGTDAKRYNFTMRRP